MVGKTMYNIRYSKDGGFSSRIIVSEKTVTEVLDRAIELYVDLWGKNPDTIQVTNN